MTTLLVITLILQWGLGLWLIYGFLRVISVGIGGIGKLWQ